MKRDKWDVLYKINREKKKDKFVWIKKKIWDKKKELENRNKIQSVKMHDNKEEGSLFDDIPTELFGRDKIIVIKQINQYKILFPKVLPKFKLKKKQH